MQVRILPLLQIEMRLPKNIKFLKTYKYPFNTLELRRDCVGKSSVFMILNEKTGTFFIDIAWAKKKTSNPLFDAFMKNFFRKPPFKEKDYIEKAIRKEGRKHFSFNIIKTSNQNFKQQELINYLKKVKIEFIKKNFVLKTFKYPDEKSKILAFCRGKHGIYLIVNEINGSCYIGKAVAENPKYPNAIYRRWYHHFNGRGGAPKLTSAMKKYGVKNFSYHLVMFDNPDNILKLEMILINGFNTEYNSIKKNTHVAGPKYTPSAETRALLRKKTLEQRERNGVMIRVRDENYKILGDYLSMTDAYITHRKNKVGIRCFKGNIWSGKFILKARVFLEYHIVDLNLAKKNVFKNNRYPKFEEKMNVLRSEPVLTGRVRVLNEENGTTVIFDSLIHVKNTLKNSSKNSSFPKIGARTIDTYAHNPPRKRRYPILIDYEYRDIPNGCLLYKAKTLKTKKTNKIF